MQHEDSSEEEEELEEEVYPPWLENIVNGEYYDHVRVLQYHDDTDSSRKDNRRCKEIEVPDAADAAAHKTASDAIRKYKISRLTPVFVVSPPGDPPYLGLVDKIWLKRGSQPVAGQAEDTFRTGDFSIECYWFYRPREVPEAAWDGVKRRRYSGAQFSFSRKKKLRPEQHCERQLLFSSHHTLHDYPDDAGLLSLEGFLHTCSLHWLGLRDPPPERLAIAKGRLLRTREPGFVVQGFLWCGGHDQPQLHPDDKRVVPLDGQWRDAATQDIVAVMRRRYKRTSAAMQQRNKLLRETAEVHAAYLRLPNALYKALEDDDGSLTAEAQQQRQARLDSWRAALEQQQQQAQQRKHGNPPSPTSPGAAAQAGGDDEDDDADDDDDVDDLFAEAPPSQRNRGAFVEEDDDD